MQQQLVQKMLPVILMKAWEKRNAILENERMALVCIPYYRCQWHFSPIGALLCCWEEQDNTLNIVLKAHALLPDCICKDNRLHVSVYSFAGSPFSGACTWDAIDITTGKLYHDGIRYPIKGYAYISDKPSFGKLSNALKPWSEHYKNRLSEGITPATFEELCAFLEVKQA